MNLMLNRPVPVNIKTIEIVVAVGNGEEVMPHDYPHRKGIVWDVLVDIDNGQIFNWPPSVPPRRVVINISPSGSYCMLTLRGDNGEFIWNWVNNHAPAFIPGISGLCINLSIGACGYIKNWEDYCTQENVALAISSYPTVKL